MIDLSVRKIARMCDVIPPPSNLRLWQWNPNDVPRTSAQSIPVASPPAPSTALSSSPLLPSSSPSSFSSTLAQSIDRSIHFNQVDRSTVTQLMIGSLLSIYFSTCRQLVMDPELLMHAYMLPSFFFYLSFYVARLTGCYAQNFLAFHSHL